MQAGPVDSIIHRGCADRYSFMAMGRSDKTIIQMLSHGAGKALGECHKVVTERKQREGSNGAALVGYEDIGAEAFGGLGRAVVATSMYIELMGTCALLFILEVGRPRSCAHLMRNIPSYMTWLQCLLSSGQLLF